MLKCDEPNKEREILRVEQLNVRDTSLRDEFDLATEDIDQPNENEGVGNERGGTELCQISD